MKVVLFCGGLGLRIRESGESVPKPMTRIGDRPILWHLMQYYAHFGVTDFVVCLGHQGDVIRRYFTCDAGVVAADGTQPAGAAGEATLRAEFAHWRITFVDTGQASNIGERLVAARAVLEDDAVFLANYADGLTDLHLPSYVAQCEASGRIATFLCAKPNLSLHAVRYDADGCVLHIGPIMETDLRINCGYFVFRREIFDYIEPGEELVNEPFARLIEGCKLGAHEFNGFFAAMDTFKDQQRLEELHQSGAAPWEVWRTSP